MHHVRLRKLVLSGILVALGLLLKVLTNFNLVSMGNLDLTLSLGILPAIFGGIALGPLYGAAIGALYDLLDTLLIPPLFALDPRYLFSAAMLGMVPGLLLLGANKLFHTRKDNFWMMLVCILIAQVLFSTLLNTYFNATYVATEGEALKAAFLSQLAVRWTALLQAPLYAFLCRIMLRLYNRLFAGAAASSKPSSPKE